MRRSSQEPATVTRGSATETATILRIISVETPVHGGGVGWDDSERTKHVRLIDPVTPVRSAAVRGQLRFWWRAIFGCRAPSLAEMREREHKLWGASERAGAVALRVSGDLKVTSRVAFAPQADIGQGLAYGAFALAPKHGLQQPPPGVLSELKGTVTLELTCPAATREEVETTVNAWTLFGGIGGRTRRGFGAVTDTSSLDPKSFVAELAKPEESTLRLVPSLWGAKFEMWTVGYEKAEAAQEAALDRLREFRQGTTGRRPRDDGRRGMSRSRWPEPDEIRRLKKMNSEGHGPRHPVRKFPRAAFGMPIVFHFKDRGEPPDTRLKPKERERMASPLILRPVRVGKQWHPAALVLRVPGATEVPTVLDQHDVRTVLHDDELDKIEPLARRNGADVLERFVDFFMESAPQAQGQGSRRNHR